MGAGQKSHRGGSLGSAHWQWLSDLMYQTEHRVPSLEALNQAQSTLASVAAQQSKPLSQDLLDMIQANAAIQRELEAGHEERRS